MTVDKTKSVEEQIVSLDETTSALQTDNDAFQGRLETLEKTVAAIGDSLKNLSPDSAVELAATVADIREKTNTFYKQVFGDVLYSA